MAKGLFVPSLKRDIVPLLHAHNLRPEGSDGNSHPTARIHIHTRRRSSCFFKMALGQGWSGALHCQRSDIRIKLKVYPLIGVLSV